MSNRDPRDLMCVCKHDGVEVGRIAAAAPSAVRYIRERQRLFGTISVDLVFNAEQAHLSLWIARMLDQLMKGGAP